MDLEASTIFNLSSPEKLQLVEDLWDDLAASPSDIPVYQWQKKELARRKSRLIDDPDSGLSWEEIKGRVRDQYGR